MSHTRDDDDPRAQVWLADPERLGSASVAIGIETLNPTELARANRFRFEADRTSFRAAHRMLRWALSHEEPSIAPSDWRFVTDEDGKPEIANEAVARDLRFNLSHTRSLVACIVMRTIDCGVDVEAMDRVADPRSLARRILSPDERTTLDELDDGPLRNRFFTYWTLREAYLKARGTGIRLPLREVAFDLDGEAITPRFGPSIHDDGTGWQFDARPVLPDHRLAVALRIADGSGRRIDVSTISELS